MNRHEKNAVLNAIRRASTILFPFITTKYGSLVLGIEKYGLVMMSKSIISYFLLFAGLGVETYAVREGARIRYNQKMLDSFVSQVFLINILSTLGSFLVLIILVFSGIAGDYSACLLVFSIELWLTTLGVEWINVIFEDFAFLTYRTIFFNVLAIVLMFMLVHKQEDFLYYAIVLVIASCGGYVINIFYVRKYVSINLEQLGHIKTHLKPIIILFFNNLATTIYLSTDVTMLGLMKGNDYVAVYDIASKIYMAIKRVSLAIIMVSIPALSYYFGNNQKDEAKALLQKLISKVFPLIIPAIIYIILFSKELILFVSGEAYIEGYYSLRILCIAGLFAFFAFFFINCIVLPNGKDKQVVRITIISACINIIMNVIMIPIYGYNAAAFSTLVSELVTMMMGYLLSRKIIILNSFPKKNIPGLILCITIAISCLTIKQILTNVFYRLVVSALVSITVYAIYFYLTRKKKEDRDGKKKHTY